MDTPLKLPLKDNSARGLPTDPCLFHFGDSPIPKYCKDRLSQKLSERPNDFSLHEWDVGSAKGVEHHIRLSDNTPFRKRSRRLAPTDIDDIRHHLHELLSTGIITESRSPHASPIVVASKKNGTVRMCIDYRTLNSRTIPDQYTVPRTRVKCVWHIISKKGIATDPAKVEAVTSWKQPTDLKSLRPFLGFCGYYRRFIANYSAIVRPLTELTKGYLPTQHGKKAAKSKGMYFKESEAFGDRWTKECTEAFQKIIQCLTNAPVLAFADPTKPYILHVDASQNGLGAVLN